MEEWERSLSVRRTDAPYPEVRAAGRNPRYAEAMLGNMAGCDSEMTAAGLYFYNHLILAEYPETAELFHRLSIAEMRHLEIFGTLARQLGADPRLWCRQGGRQTWWTPGYLHYTPKPGPLLRVAVRAEEQAARRYEEQARWIGDLNVVANLERIALDERAHAELLRSMLERWEAGRGAK